jgi:tetratricopeptide (TPR) repeat protein
MYNIEGVLFVLNYDEIFVLMDSDDFESAIKMINETLLTELPENEYSRLYYLLGEINTNYKYKKGNKKDAERFYLESTRRKPSFHIAYVKYTNLIDDNHIKERFLNEGLVEHPKSTEIITELLKIDNNYSRGNGPQIIDSKITASNVYKLIEVLYEKNEHKLIDTIINSHAKEIMDDDLNGYLQLQLVRGISKIELAMYSESLEICLEILTKDTHNSLTYCHYVLLSYSYFKLNDFDKAIEYILKVPVNNILEDFFGSPYSKMDLLFDNVMSKYLTELSKIKHKNFDATHVKAILALYLYKPSETFDLIRYTSSHLNNLIQYSKKHKDNIHVAVAIYNMANNFKRIEDMYLSIYNLIMNDSNPTDNFCIFSEDVDHMSYETCKMITDHLQKNINLLYDKDLQVLFEQIIDPLISLIVDTEFAEKSILLEQLCKTIDFNQIYRYSSKLFELAVSLNEKSDLRASQKYYSYILEQNKSNSAVLNNLGVIYHKQNQYIEAEKLFAEAYSIDESKDLYYKNLVSIRNENLIRKQALQYILDEPIKRVLVIKSIYEAVSNGYFSLTGYSHFDKILNTLVDKNDFNKMVELRYFEYIDSSFTPKGYYLNLFIVDFFNHNNKVILMNKDKSQFTLKQYISLGYDGDLIKQISNIKNTEYADIISNDVNECVNSIIINNQKSAIVMAGSIIEALLLNYYIEHGVTNITLPGKQPKKVSECKLQEMIDYAQSIGILSNRNFHMAHVLRDFRNYIHPDKVLREKYIPNQQEVDTIWNLFKQIINDILPRV